MDFIFGNFLILVLSFLSVSLLDTSQKTNDRDVLKKNKDKLSQEEYQLLKERVKIFSNFYH